METIVKGGIGVIVAVHGLVVTGVRKGSHGAGKLAFPGGHIEPSDATLEAAGEREVLEETGMVVKVRQILGSPDLLATYDILSEDGMKRYLTTYMVADYVSGGTFYDNNKKIKALEPHKCDYWQLNSFDELIEVVRTHEQEVWIPMRRLLPRRSLLGL